MQVSIHDRDALLAISPAALSAYARFAGWSQYETYREHSDIYIGETLPEIIVPRTARLGDYASAVATLIKTFAQVAVQDELAVYRSLVIADRDVIRIRATESDDGNLSLEDTVQTLSTVPAQWFWLLPVRFMTRDQCTARGQTGKQSDCYARCGLGKRTRAASL